ncbi:MAG: hypothetical protein IPG58_17005 [Acidobacteria bacterium]|nr:hypothetical protein [Acidobacteriota bacterium]
MYEGLTVQVFDTPYYVFATSGIISAAKYNIEDGKTYFAPDTHLFKNDLKLVSPKAGSKIAATGIEVKWDAYPDAAYYKYSIHADSSSGAETNFDYINKRVDGTSVSLDKPLVPGSYTAKVEAFTANDRRLSQTSQDMKFTVTEHRQSRQGRSIGDSLDHFFDCLIWPTNTAREMMLWPMLNSVISGIAARAPTLR